MKKYERYISHDTVKLCSFFLKNWLLVEKMNMDMNMVNLDTSIDKSGNFHFDVLLLSIAYKVSAKKV